MIPREEFVRLVVETVVRDRFILPDELTPIEEPIFRRGAVAAAEYAYTLIQVREVNRGQ